MIEITYPLPFLLIMNNILTITLIVNQNENTKDFTNNKISTFSSNPLEKITWICVLIEILLLLLKVKVLSF